MLKQLNLENFTAFKKAELHFASNLNVIVGENGTGKTHILKLAYSIINVSARGIRDQGSQNPTKGYLQTAIAKKIIGVFKPDELGRLARRDKRGRQRCSVQTLFHESRLNICFTFNTSSKTEVVVEKTPSAWVEKMPVFLPTRELLTIYPGFVSLYESSDLPFEETWRDTCLLLGSPLARGPREKRIGELLEPIEHAMGGKVVLEQTGKFYLNYEGINMEMHLVAEGLRKFATIARLIATGSLIEKGFLFWDEPETNLNPKVIKIIARTILHLALNGIQVFIATHSLFLMRELDILLNTKDFSDLNSQFIGLHHGTEGIQVLQGSTIDDIGEISSLQEELSQTDRFLESGTKP